MRVFVTGATGLVGQAVVARLLAAGHAVTALSRRARPGTGQPGLEWRQGDPAQPGAWQAAVDGHDALIHLAGENLSAHRWTEREKQRLVASRLESTAHLLGACRAAAQPPRVLVSASAVGYYGDAGDLILKESAPPGHDFLARLCQQWEAAAEAGERLGLRVVRLRFGIVLSPHGGAVAKMLPAFRWCLGGRLGSGRHWYAWIDEQDLVTMIVTALADPAWQGAINAVAPEPVRQADFAAVLGHVLRRPTVLPMPRWLLRLAVGEVADALLESTRAVPERARQLGFHWNVPELHASLAAAVGWER